MLDNTTHQVASASKATILTSVLMSAVFGIAVTGCTGANENAGGDTTDAQPAREQSNVAHETSSAHTNHSEADRHHENGVHAQTTRLEFTSTPSAIEHANLATWRLRIVDAKSGNPIPELTRAMKSSCI